MTVSTPLRQGNTSSFRLTELLTPEDDLHYSVWCALRRLLPNDAVITTWELRNARDAVEGARRKRLGALAGWPDMGVLWRGRMVLLEIKRDGGVLSRAQRELHARLAIAGFVVTVCTGRRAPEQALAAVQVAGIPVRGRLSA